uniref:Uncharacterized protein n=1 Tax=Alexandrium andersonii TaxID=327968 RepID=A0A7S2D969_9DINO
MGAVAWQQGCAPRPAATGWCQQRLPMGAIPPTAVQSAAFPHAPRPHAGHLLPGQQVLPVQQVVGQPPMPGHPFSAALGIGGAAQVAPAPQGSMLDDFDEDDAALLAMIEQVEDKVKQEQQLEQDYEKILKEKKDDLDLELMLVDVDPNEC